MAHFTWIEEGEIAASSCPSAEELAGLSELGIRAIVTLTEDPLSIKTGVSEEALSGMGFELFHAPIIDYHAPDDALAYQVVDFLGRMKEEGKPALIHCQAGQERTGTLLHAYYLLQGLSIEEASARIYAVRPQSSFDKLMSVQQTFLRAFFAGLSQ